jgi:hypothetical protein
LFIALLGKKKLPITFKALTLVSLVQRTKHISLEPNRANSACSGSDHDDAADKTRLTHNCKITNNVHILK